MDLDDLEQRLNRISRKLDEENKEEKKRDEENAFAST